MKETVPGEPTLVLRNLRLPSSPSPKTLVCVGSRIDSVLNGAETPSLPVGVDAIDLEGALALPGFIDVHSHADGRAWQPEISLPKVEQGIAFEIVGNCGLGPAPNCDDHGWRNLISGTIGGVPESGDLGTFPDYLRQLQDNNVGVWPLLGALLPYGAVRASVAGFDGEVDDRGIDQMRDVIREALGAGAVGVSLGLVYPPNDASTFDELARTLTPLRDHGAVLATHIRSQANRWIPAIDEVLRLSKQLDCRLLISHLCVGGARNQWQLDWVLSRLQEARREGVDVWFDHHPYRAGSTSLTQLLPTQAFSTGPEGVEVSLNRDELAKLLDNPSTIEGWENYVELIGASNILLAGSQVEGITGHTVAEIQSDWGLSLVDTLLRLFQETRGNAAIILEELYRQEAIERISELDFGMLSTDGIHGVAIPHPRLYGTYPYAFSSLVSTGLMSEAEFVDRTSVRPAEVFNLERSPGLKAGANSDLVLIDPQTFGHRVDYLNPAQPVTGVRALVLGGEVWKPERA